MQPLINIVRPLLLCTKGLDPCITPDG